MITVFLILPIVTLFLSFAIFLRFPEFNVVFLLFLFHAALLIVIGHRFHSKAKKTQLLLLSCMSCIVVLIPSLIGIQLKDALICSSYGRVSISELNRITDDISGHEIVFCGHVDDCRIIVVGDEGTEFEVCLIQDVSNSDLAVQFYTMRITHSSDPLVQISNESHSLRGLEQGELVIRSGIFYNEFVRDCVFCDAEVQPFADIFRSTALFDRVLES